MTTNATPRRTTRAHPARAAIAAAIAAAVLAAGAALVLGLGEGGHAPSQAEECRTAVQAYIDDFVEHGTQDPSIDAAKLACSTVPPAQVQIIAQAVWDANGKSLATAAVAQVFDGS